MSTPTCDTTTNAWDATRNLPMETSVLDFQEGFLSFLDIGQGPVESEKRWDEYDKRTQGEKKDRRGVRERKGG